jgi:hypothetical protein
VISIKNKILEGLSFLGLAVTRISDAQFYTKYMLSNNLGKAVMRYFGVKPILKEFCWEFNMPSDQDSIHLLQLQLCHDYLMDIYLESYDEFFALKSFFKKNINNKTELTVIDLGGGIGRSSVFLNNLNNWDECGNRILLVDKSVSNEKLNTYAAEGKPKCKEDQTNYHESPDINSSAYNNSSAVLKFSSINNTKNLDFVDYDVYSDSDIQFDLLYSFQSVGYHYSIVNAIENLKLHDKARDGAYLIFGIRREYENANLINYEVPFYIGEMFKFIKLVKGKHRQDFIIFQKKF